MFIDPDKPDSINHNINVVREHLRRLRGVLIHGAARNKGVVILSSITNPPMMQVRLHTNKLGEMWWNTGDPRHDTQNGIGHAAGCLTAIYTDAQIDAMARELVAGVVKILNAHEAS